MRLRGILPYLASADIGSLRRSLAYTTFKYINKSWLYYSICHGHFLMLRLHLSAWAPHPRHSKELRLDLPDT